MKCDLGKSLPEELSLSFSLALASVDLCKLLTSPGWEAGWRTVFHQRVLGMFLFQGLGHIGKSRMPEFVGNWKR